MEIYKGYEDEEKEYYMRDGKFYHNTPFSDAYEITEEQFKAGLEQLEISRKIAEEKRQQKERYENLLDTLGYVEPPHASGYNLDVDQYKIRLIEVLSPKVMNELESPQTHVDQGIEKVISSTNEQISQTLALYTPKTFDIYKQNIEKLLTECYGVVKERAIAEKEYRVLLQLFKLGHITDPVLFRSFENLKREDTKYCMQRMFKYGSTYKSALPEDLVKQETSIIDEIAIVFLVYELKYKNNIILADLDDRAEKVHEKLRNSFIAQIKDVITGGKYWSDVIRDIYLHSLQPDYEDVYDSLEDSDRWIVDKTLAENDAFADRAYWDQMLTYERNTVVRLISGTWQPPHLLSHRTQDEILLKREFSQWKNAYNSHDMQQYFGFGREELNQCVNEAKEGVVKDFLYYIEHENFDTIKRYGETSEAMNAVSMANIARIYDLISKLPETYNIDIQEIHSKLQKWIDTMAEQGVGKLINKEIVDYDATPGRSINASYKQSLAEIESRLEMLYRLCYKNSAALQITIPPVLLEWKQQQPDITTIMGSDSNINRYHNAYIQHYENKFKAGRKKNAITEYNIDVTTDSENLAAQLVPIMKQRLLEICHKRIKHAKSKSGAFFRGVVSKRTIFTIINNNVLFHSGLMTLMKDLMPDDEKRKKFWKETKRKVAEECLEEIVDKLSHEDTADHVSYFLYQPLLQVFKTYGGKLREAHISISHETIESNYLGYVRDNIGKEVKRDLNVIRNFVKGKSKKDAPKVYEKFNDATLYVTCFFMNYISKALQKSVVRRSYEASRDVFEENKQQFASQYPGSYLLAISRLGYTADEMGNMFPKDFLDACIKVFAEEEQLQHSFFEKLVPEWMQRNLGPGGKMQRMIEEELVWKKNVEPAIFAIQYVNDHAKSIIIHDLQEILYRGEEFQWPTLTMLDDIISNFLNQRKERFGQKEIGDVEENKHLIDG